MPYDGVRVRGYRELALAFKRMSAAESKALKIALASAAEPVRRRAETLADDHIRNIGDKWDAMKTGVTTKVVYVAPARRRTGSRSLARPNLAPLLMDRAMSPALEETEPQVVELLDGVLGGLGAEWAHD